MKLYIVDYWVPFPSSEYGGLCVFAAHNTDEVIKMAKEITSDYEMGKYGESMFNDLEIQLVGDTNLFDSPCVVDQFLT